MISEGTSNLKDAKNPFGGLGGGGGGDMDGMLKQMMAQFEELEKNPGGLDSMMENMMKEVLTKETLYEPIKTMADKFPAFLTDNKSTLTPETYRNYEKQLHCYQQVCLAYECSPPDTTKVFAILTELQAYGEPPKELIGEMPDLAAMGLGGGMPGMPGMGSAPGGGLPPVSPEEEAALKKMAEDCKMQ